MRVIFQLAEDERRLHNWIAALGRGHADESIATLLLDLPGALSRAARRLKYSVSQEVDRTTRPSTESIRTGLNAG